MNLKVAFNESNRFLLVNQKDPILVIGSGPVGLEAAQSLLKNNIGNPIVLFGKEEVVPYNRVKLSSFLSGQCDWSQVENQTPKDSDSFSTRLGFRIDAIYPEAHYIVDQQGQRHSYSKLILALGSKPHIPPIPGVYKKGVFTLRDINDVTALLARQVSSRHCVILGGGLLGIEAAKAMLRWNTQVTIVEHNRYLMFNQLDEQAGDILQSKCKNLGIHVVTGQTVAEIKGDNKVQSIHFKSGDSLECDTLIISTGIIPNKDLAREAGLQTAKGIVVSDTMQTSDPDIYAVGECAEHNNQTYGLVAPGLEQASVAVSHILGRTSHYKHSLSASRLKVIDYPVLSLGTVGANSHFYHGDYVTYFDKFAQVYRKLLIKNSRLLGVLNIGDWDEIDRVQQAALQKKWIFPWQLYRFKKTGQLWLDHQSDDVAMWPASSVICQCTQTTKQTIEAAALEHKQCTADMIAQSTGAGSVCGSCRPLVQQLTQTNPKSKSKEKFSSFYLYTGLVTLVMALFFFLPDVIPYQQSVIEPIAWDFLWKDSFFKQITGFTVLGAFAVGLLVSLRKRWNSLQKKGEFAYWRVLHLLMGIIAVLSLLVHTGLRMGNGLNYWLMLSFVSLILLGGLAVVFQGCVHLLDPVTQMTAKNKLQKWHIYLFWPVPALLGFHILKSYWF